MTDSNKAATALAHRVISGAVENSSPHPEARDMIEHLVRNRTRVSDDGDILIVDDNGTVRLSDRSGFPNMTLGEYLDELKASKPTLFVQGKGSSSKVVSSNTEDNPFRPGPDFNVTQQMILLSKEPAKAARLQAEAGR